MNKVIPAIEVSRCADCHFCVWMDYGHAFAHCMNPPSDYDFRELNGTGVPGISKEKDPLDFIPDWCMLQSGKVKDLACPIGFCYVIYSQSESEIQGEPMFWSNVVGWTSFIGASVFVTDTAELPIAGSVEWMRYADGACVVASHMQRSFIKAKEAR